VARRGYEQDENLPGMEPPDESRARRNDGPAVPRPRVRPVNPPKREISRVRVLVAVAIIVVTVAAGLYAFKAVEQFLIRDPRFALNGEDGSSPTLEIRGATHASQRALAAAFRDDSGLSVYLMPLGDRRTSLRKVDWVKDAAVARAWPNRILVNVAERTPVAFVTLGSSKFGLIDEDGVILPPAADRFHLPVLIGVQQRDSIESRRRSVRLLMKLVAAVGDSAANFAEVDVSDPSNLKVRQSSSGRMITLLLGDGNYGTRYRNFKNHYSEIRQKLPGAGTLDLRIEDRITVVDE
jgi:cell division septal protein FtsQ